MKSILLFKKLLGLVEMMSGLVNVSFSLPEWQAVKMIFFAPWSKTVMFYEEVEEQKNCEISSASQKGFGASLNDVWASKY